MTRINVVPVSTLSGPHLVAEYRELPRVFGLAHKASMSSKPWTDKQPKEYCLGTGHVLFFYDKLGFLSDRHQELVREMLHRGFKPTYTASLAETWGSIPKGYWKGYKATQGALELNRGRILSRNLAIDARNSGK